MRQSHQKIQQLENLFQVSEAPVREFTERSLTAKQNLSLQTIMDFIRTEIPLPESLIEWLAQLGLLYGVPFSHLVPDEQMVTGPAGTPPNLMRCFYIDMKWIDSMIDGALSIGTHNSKDFKLQQAVHKTFRRRIEDEMLDMRVKIKGKGLSERTHREQMGTLSGFILRSPLIRQWPGIEIRGFKQIIDLKEPAGRPPEFEDRDNILDVLRMERLAPDTLFMIFKGVPKSILVKEPSESVYSGLTYTEDGYRLVLRQLRGKDKIGKPLMDDGALEYHLNSNRKKDFRDDPESRVLNIRNLRENIAAKYYNKAKLEPRDMAVLFINSPRYYFFQAKPS